MYLELRRSKDCCFISLSYKLCFCFVLKEDNHSPLGSFILSIVLSIIMLIAIVMIIWTFIIRMVCYLDINYLSIHRRTFFKIFPVNLCFPSIRTNQISMRFLLIWMQSILSIRELNQKKEYAVELDSRERYSLTAFSLKTIPLHFNLIFDLVFREHFFSFFFLIKNISLLFSHTFVHIYLYLEWSHPWYNRTQNWAVFYGIFLASYMDFRLRGIVLR
jgi:hypothetical protein